MAGTKPDRPLEPEEKAKLAAEADMFLAIAGARRAQGLLAATEAEKERLVVDMQVLANDRETEKRARELAAFKQQHIYQFTGGVDAGTCAACITELNFWHQSAPGSDWEIVFDSPGGGVFAGMGLFDFIQEMRRAGHYITTSTRGMAASMGGILLQAGDKRVMGAESYVLIHEISSYAGGKVGEIEDAVELLKKMEERVLDIFAARSHLTKAKLKANWRRKDWWIDSTECLKLGLVDEVR